MLCQLDRRVVVASTQEILDQHAIQARLLPLDLSRGCERVVRLEMFDASLASLRGFHLVCDTLFRLCEGDLNKRYVKANIWAISSDTHQLPLIKLHHFKLERYKSIL